MKTTWRKMESWKPEQIYFDAPPNKYQVFHADYSGALTDKNGRGRLFRTRAAALRAANAANRRDGLPEVL